MIIRLLAISMLFGLAIAHVLWSNALDFYLQSSNLVMTKFEDYLNLIEGNDNYYYQQEFIIKEENS